MFHQKLSTFFPLWVCPKHRREEQREGEVRKFSLSAKSSFSQTRSKHSQEKKSPEMDKHRCLSNSLRAPWIYCIHCACTQIYVCILSLSCYYHCKVGWSSKLFKEIIIERERVFHKIICSRVIWGLIITTK